MDHKMKASSVAEKIILICVLVVIIFPFIWLLSSSFKVEKDIIKYPPHVFAARYTLEQYKAVFKQIPIMRYMGNTVIFAGTIAGVSIFFDAMTGYAFARIQFKRKEVLFAIVLMTMMIPFQVLMIPLFLEIHMIGWLDTYWGLIVPRLTSAYGIFMMRSFFVSLPRDLEEAARIDGLNEYRIFSKIMLPLCKPALITLFIFHLMANWNDLIYPLMLTSKTEMRTLPAGLAMFVGERTVKYGPTMSATVISLIPMLVLYIMAQKYFVQGIAMSGMKE